MGAPADSEPSLASSTGAGGAPAAGLEPGQREIVAGRYRLVEHIAEGGMGSVYVAEHTLSRKRLALKVVHPYLCKGRQGVERFRREVSAAAEIDHPGIVQIYDAGVDDDGGFFMAMELLEGESLGDRLRREWPGMATSVKLVEGMLEPLAKAHAKGFIHRDLKPDNVFIAIDEDGRERVKLLDFGLARDVEKGGPTRTGITFGTPEYMSPEQAISARKVRSPGDVWSVGVMLYELLSGVHPFTGETPNAIMANAIKEPLPPLRDSAPHVPGPLCALVERCLEKEPADRPQTAGEMLEELRAVLGAVELDETVPSAPTPPTSWGDDDSEPNIAISSSFPVEARPSRQSKLATHIVEPEPSAVSQAPPGRRPSFGVIVGGVGLLVLSAVGGAVLYLAMTGDGEAPREAVASIETGVVREPPEPSETVPAAPSEEAAEPVDEESLSDEDPTVTDEAADEAAQADEATAARPAGRTPRRVAPRRAAQAQEPAGPSALEEARECMARGDQACARRVLEQRARTATERAMLIDLYRSSGRMGPALDAMEEFVRRHRNAPQAAEYRETLRRYR